MIKSLSNDDNLIASNRTFINNSDFTFASIDSDNVNKNGNGNESGDEKNKIEREIELYNPTFESISLTLHIMDSAFDTCYLEMIRNPKNIIMILLYFPRHCVERPLKTVTVAFKWITDGWPLRESFQLLQAIFDQMMAKEEIKRKLKGRDVQDNKIKNRSKGKVGNLVMELNVEFWQEFYWPCQQYLQKQSLKSLHR